MPDNLVTPWTAPDGLYARYGAALIDADTHSCEQREGVQYSLLLGAITSIRDEEMAQLRKDLDLVTKRACRDSEDLEAALTARNRAREDCAKILEVVSAYAVESNDCGGLDANDLTDRLDAAGFTLPDDEAA